MELGLSDLGTRIRGALHRFVTATGLRRRAFDYDCDSNASKEEGLGPGCSRSQKRKAPSEEREDNEESSPSFWKRFRAALGCGPGHGHVGHSYSQLPQSNRREERLKQLLQVPLIMRKVARSLPQADLLLLRLTCRLWHSVMSFELRRSHCPSVRVEGECALVVKRLGRLADTLDSGKGLIPAPMSELTIAARRGSGSERKIFSHPRVRALFSVWGPGHLTRLSIRAESNMDHSSQYLYITGLRRVLFNLTPALVEFRLSWQFTHDFRPLPAVAAEDMNDDDDGWSWQELPRLRSLAMWWIGESEDMDQLLRDLLRAATGLEALDQTLCMGTALRFLLSNPTASPSLSRLTLGSSFVDNELLEGVTELSARSPGGLRLTSLTGLNLSPRPAEVERLTSLLPLQAEYLTCLSLEFWDFGRGFGDPTPFTLPPLPALESLKMRPHIGSLNFLRFSIGAYSNLKTLSLTYEPFAPPGAWAACLAGLAVSPVTDLTVYGQLESVEVLEGLAAHFPGVTRLTLGLRVECLPYIWEKWPRLEFLEVSLHGTRGASSLDEDLTGIGREQCELLHEQLVRGEIYPEQALADLKTVPGLPDLKNLREFRLSFGYGSVPEENVLTDVSGYFAFAFAAPGSRTDSRLQRISFMGGSSNISDECRRAIRERLGLFSLIDI